MIRSARTSATSSACRLSSRSRRLRLQPAAGLRDRRIQHRGCAPRLPNRSGLWVAPSGGRRADRGCRPGIRPHRSLERIARISAQRRRHAARYLARSRVDRRAPRGRRRDRHRRRELSLQALMAPPGPGLHRPGRSLGVAMPFRQARAICGIRQGNRLRALRPMRHGPMRAGDGSLGPSGYRPRQWFPRNARPPQACAITSPPPRQGE
jgi:hypothetical protein